VIFQASYWNIFGRPEGNRLLGRPRHRWGNNVKMDLKEIGFGLD